MLSAVIIVCLLLVQKVHDKYNISLIDQEDRGISCKR
jgi:hypothetical protein